MTSPLSHGLSARYQDPIPIMLHVVASTRAGGEVEDFLTHAGGPLPPLVERHEDERDISVERDDNGDVVGPPRDRHCQANHPDGRPAAESPEVAVRSEATVKPPISLSMTNQMPPP